MRLPLNRWPCQELGSRHSPPSGAVHRGHVPPELLAESSTGLEICSIAGAVLSGVDTSLNTKVWTGVSCYSVCYDCVCCRGLLAHPQPHHCHLRHVCDPPARPRSFPICSTYAIYARLAAASRLARPWHHHLTTGWGQEPQTLCEINTNWCQCAQGTPARCLCVGG